MAIFDSLEKIRIWKVPGFTTRSKIFSTESSYSKYVFREKKIWCGNTLGTHFGIKILIFAQISNFDPPKWRVGGVGAG